VLPQHAQDTYKEASGSAHAQHAAAEDRAAASREETARRVAWSVVKKKYEKAACDDWHSKFE